MHRIPTTVENYRRAIINPETPSLKTVFKPTIEGFKETVEPLSKSRMEKASHELNPEVLTSKLNALKQQMEKKEYFDKALTDRLKTAQLQTQFEDDDQSILDQHITRVFSPYLSPGSVSPRHVNRPHHRSSEMSSSLTDFGVFYTFEGNYFDDFSLFDSSYFPYSYTRNAPFKIDSRTCIYVDGVHYNEKISSQQVHFNEY